MIYYMVDHIVYTFLTLHDSLPMYHVMYRGHYYLGEL